MTDHNLILSDEAFHLAQFRICSAFNLESIRVLSKEEKELAEKFQIKYSAEQKCWYLSYEGTFCDECKAGNHKGCQFRGEDCDCGCEGDAT